MEHSAFPSIVAIDDEVEFLELIRRVCASIDFHAFITTEPSEFLAEVERTRPDIVVLDLNMPQLDGIELIRALATLGTRSRVVVASGFDRRVTETALRLGTESGLNMASPLEKPMQVAQLRAALRAIAPLHKTVTRESIEHALAAGEFSLNYQPRLNLQTSEFGSAEALIRWTHPMHGPIAPSDFIPKAEALGCITDITNWVFRTAIQDCAEWRRHRINIGVAINISAHDVANVALPDYVGQLCRAAQIPPGILTIELTETAAAEKRTLLMDVMARFRLKGFLLSLDDFGTGYSSLSMLQKLPFCELKIDRSFIQTIADNRDNQSITKATIALARALSLETVAEGVEDRSALELLRKFGCDHAQGYLIAKPLGFDALRYFLSGPGRSD